MNPYQQALARIIELEDTNAALVQQLVADAIVSGSRRDENATLKMKASLAHAQNVDLGNQLSATFALLGEARDLLVITALESPLRKNIMELIERIDAFYPRGD